MTVRLRGKVWWVDVCLGGQRKQARCKTEIDGKRQEIKFLEELQAAQATTEALSGSWTVKQALDKCMEAVWKGSKSETMYKLASAHILRHFAQDRLLATISTPDLDAWVQTMKDKRGNTGGTINRKLATLSKAMTFAVERGGLKVKPRIPRQKEAKHRIRWLTDAEEDQLLGLACEWAKPEHWDFTVVKMDTGLRMGEMLRLTDKDLDFDTKMISAWLNKNGEPRSVPMTKRVLWILRRRAETDKGRLFPYRYRWYHKFWKRAKNHMGLQGDDAFTPHCLRHTCATRLVKLGYSIFKVQKWLGHENLEQTKAYAHLAPADLTDGAALLDVRPRTANLVVRKGG